MHTLMVLTACKRNVDKDVFLLLQVSFRMVLPSEGHRRRQRQDRRPLSPRLSLSSSISSDMASPSPSPSPSASSLLLPDEPSVPKELSQASILSVGDESFDDFTLRMIKQYVRDQDARARHQVRREDDRSLVTHVTCVIQSASCYT